MNTANDSIYADPMELFRIWWLAYGYTDAEMDDTEFLFRVIDVYAEWDGWAQLSMWI